MGSDIDSKPIKPCHIDQARSLRNQAMSLSKGKPLPYPSPRRPGAGGPGVGSRGGVPGVVRGFLGILSAPRRLQEASKLTFFGSRGLQERSKRLPRGFLRASASKMRFGSHFDTFLTPKREPWTSKTKEILCTVGDFGGFTIFSLIRFWNQFKDPPGTLLGAHLALRQCETSLLGALGPAKSRSQLCFLGPEGLQEPSKSAPYAPGSLPLADQASSRAPRGLQETSRRPPGPI